jgi:signal transduction histidine kinase
MLPLQQALEELEQWRHAPGGASQSLERALHRLISAYGAEGAYIVIDGPPLPPLDVGLGTIAARPDGEHSTAAGPLPITVADDGPAIGRLWIDGPPEARHDAARALTMCFDAAWSRAQARAAGRHLEALDQAVRGIADIRSAEEVLQQIVDRVRDLSDAEYAALGVLGPLGSISAFITSGLSDERRAAIGHIPRGLGLLGLIIHEGRSFRIDDIATDPRRYGFPANHPEMHAFLGVPVRHRGEVLGNLYLTNKRDAPAFTEADLRLVEMFALHAGIAITNARLHEDAARLAVLEERHRISQDLHDSIIQSLYAVALSLEDLPDIFAEHGDEGAARVDRAIDSIHDSIRDIRNFIMGLRPELLAGADLAGGIHALGDEFRLNTLIDLEVDLGEHPPVPAEVANHVLAISREALSNIARHSGATRASIELGHEAGMLRLVIGDNGTGFDPDQPRAGRQLGLRNLQARARLLNGSLEIRSEIGAGTRLEVLIPIEPGSPRQQQEKDG